MKLFKCLAVSLSLVLAGPLPLIAHAQNIEKKNEPAVSLYSLQGSVFSPPPQALNSQRSESTKAIAIAQQLRKPSYGPTSWELLDQSPLPPGPTLPFSIQEEPQVNRK